MAITRTLPDYATPPAFETMMAFHFARLKWDIPHFGLFWGELKTRYPKYEVHPPLGEYQIKFESGRPDSELAFPVRCWFINEENNRLIQVQDTAFLQSWRKVSAEEAYLNYGKLQPLFWGEWEHFCAFAKEQGLGSPNVLLCEVSYVNHLEKGLGWDKFSQLDVIFPSIGSLGGREFLGRPDTAFLNLSFSMPTQDGRLNVSIQPAVRQMDQKEILQLTVTGKCRPSSSDPRDLIAGLDLCRGWVVNGFDDFTSQAMHQLWGKK